MRKVAAGEMWVEKSLRNKLVGIERIALTPRERQLLGLLARGLKNKEIAYAMDITEGTVKMYLTHLFRKAGANDRLELALFTLRNLSGNRTGAAEPDAQAPPEDVDTSGAGRFIPGFMIVDRAPATV
jgi:DNA-binding CsgD family transcriptional regulator